ncbi:MAG: hypothetical protein IKO16_05755 [Lachnospiraceae bacterium]|nr:hypothetical protein [Lachnospiraceae bacterium]
MSEIKYDSSIIKAANLIILRKVRDKMGIDRATFEREMGIKKSSVDSIIAREKKEAGKGWKYKEVARKMKMDERVFAGERLLHVGTKISDEAIANYDEIVHQLVGNEASDMKESIDMVRKLISESEYPLWEVVLSDMDNREKDPKAEGFIPLGDSIGQQSKMSILDDVARQVDEESFNDDQLWKFWNYFKKL